MTDDIPIKVHFRFFPAGDVIALWDEPADCQGNISSYQHVGQHGAASPELITSLRPATEDEKGDLRAELQRIGYVLEEQP